MRKRIAGTIGILGLLIALSGPHARPASGADACGACFRIADWYWNNVVDMGAREIYEWLGLCLEVNAC